MSAFSNYLPSCFLLQNNKCSMVSPFYAKKLFANLQFILPIRRFTYSTWVKLFQLHAHGYKVLDHIDGTPGPPKTDPSYDAWVEIDSIVLQWIYRTISEDLLSRVLEDESTAHTAWTRIKNIFLNNKGSRAAALEHEFTNLTLKSMPSLEACCQRLKELYVQLSDVESLVSQNRLVLQLVRGLPSEFDTTASYINQTLPSWDAACSMLELELHRQTARETLAPPPLAAAGSHDQTPLVRPRRENQNRGPPRNPNQRRPNNHQARNTRGPTSTHNITPRRPTWPQNQSNVPAWAPWWMMPPPCPYPTKPNWNVPWTAPPRYQPPARAPFSQQPHDT
ncbi:hypothetical protein LXL04_033566 [Taraxacum kok-saghyz]